MHRITEKCPDVEGDLLPGEGVWHFPYLSSGGIGRGRGRVGEGWGGRESATSSSEDSVACHLGTVASELFDSSSEKEDTVRQLLVGKVHVLS